METGLTSSKYNDQLSCFNRTLEVWKPDLCRWPVLGQRGFQSNLRGMETGFGGRLSAGRPPFQSNLRGMETCLLIRANGVAVAFQSNLRGMETQKCPTSPLRSLKGFNRTLEVWKHRCSENICSCIIGFNRTLEVWKLWLIRSRTSLREEFQSNLRGMETIVSTSHSNSLAKVSIEP